jgi:hypothetical protein
MYAIPENVRQRLLLAHLTPARLTQVFDGLARAINEQGVNDAAVELEYAMKGETFGEADLLPSIIIGLQKAVPTPPKPVLVLPELELPEGTRG